MTDFSKLLAPDEQSKQRYTHNQRCNPLRVLVSLALRTVFIFWIVGGINWHQNLFAQTDLGSITGTIRDRSEAAIPNCQIEIKNARTNAIRTVMTDANGFYSAPSLTVGPYSITATAKGFRRSTQAVTLTLGGLTVDLQLEVGDVSQEITVTGGAGSIALQTDSHDLSVSVSSAQLVNLPNNGRSVLSIATLGPASQPGTDSGVDAGDETFYGQLASSVIISGLGNAHTLFLQDGVDNTNLLTQTANILASVEATQEATTLLNGAPARFSEPAVIDVVTKSGSNQFHGTAYDFLQNDAANAKNWFATTKPAQRYNQFGGNFGGPILRDRLFGFFDYSGLRSHTANVNSLRVPTLAERGGNFAADPEVIYDPSTYNPTTGTSSPFPSNTISAISPFAQLWLKNYPLPNTPLGANNVNYIVNLPAVSNYDEYLGRVDWNISQKNQIFGTIARLNDTAGSESITPGLFGIFDTLKGTNASIEDTFVVSTNVVNVAKIGYNRSNLFRTQLGQGAQDYASFYGLANVNPLSSQWTPPSISLTNYASLGDPYSPQGAIQNRYQFADELDWKLGRHTFSFGGEFVRTQFNGNWVVGNNGIYSFDGTATSQYIGGVRSSSDQGNALADLELGYPVTGNALNGVSVGSFRSFDIAGYVQDDWKLTPKLTLNLGIRYDLNNPPNDKNGHGALYDLTENRNIAGTWNTNYNDWGPRVGFSFEATKGIALRGGYGIYYAPILYNNLQFEVLYSPNVINQFYTLNINNPVDIQNLFGPNPPSALGQGGYTIAKTLKDTSVQEWNFDIEKTLSSNTLLTLAYIGNVTRHQSARADFNQPDALSAGNTSGKFDVKPQPLAGQIDGQYNDLSANYNAFTAEIQRTYTNGLQFLGSYTWSKAMDILDGDNADVQSYYNPQLTYGPAGFDRTNNILISGIYELPFGPGRKFGTSDNLLYRNIIGGWQISGIQQFATGQPIQILANNNADTSSLHSVYANKICDPSSGFRHTETQFYNPACYVQPGPGQYGTARSGPRQPHLVNTNISLMKIFSITGRQQLQFRAEAFDVFNHPTLGTGNTNVNAPNAGLVTFQSSGLSNGPRVMQFALRYSF
jgi:Carboxypeptidase regulatory-like domain/TonB dependent receptor